MPTQLALRFDEVPVTLAGLVAKPETDAGSDATLGGGTFHRLGMEQA